MNYKFFFNKKKEKKMGGYRNVEKIFFFKIFIRQYRIAHHLKYKRVQENYKYIKKKNVEQPQHYHFHLYFRKFISQILQKKKSSI